uniref:Uncharacterized protein n=1 Tax=Noctiluca scintillans TaxID=2966 RepID=A0A7S1EWD8_NOCSC
MNRTQIGTREKGKRGRSGLFSSASPLLLLLSFCSVLFCSVWGTKQRDRKQHSEMHDEDVQRDTAPKHAPRELDNSDREAFSCWESLCLFRWFATRLSSVTNCERMVQLLLLFSRSCGCTSAASGRGEAWSHVISFRA